MENNPKQNSDTPIKNKPIFKFLLLAGIVIVVAGLFLIKNKPFSSNAGNSSAIGSGITASDNRPLQVSSIDIDALLTHGLPVVVDFGADSCAPCKEMEPILEKLHKEMQDTAVIQFIDVWKHTDGAKDFPVRVIPTQMFVMPNGEPYIPSEAFEEEVGVSFIKYVDNDTGELVFTVHEGGLTEEQLRLIIEDMEANA